MTASRTAPIHRWFDLPEVGHPNNVKLLWISGFYDGPLSGMAVHDGKTVWFECLVPEWWRHRDYGLYELTEPERLELTRRHELFQEHVGGHMDVSYDHRQQLHRSHTVKPQSGHHQYYDQASGWDPIDVAGSRAPYARFALVRSPHRRRARSINWWNRQLAT